MINLDKLNNEQKDAVLNTEGYIRVIASPGSGKTRALTHRFAYLVDDMHVDKNNILCITYTNKAADEMKERIFKLLKITTDERFNISTIHSYCTSFLREYFALNPIFPADFEVFDETALNKRIKSFYRTSTIKNRELGIKKKEIAAYKTNNIGYASYLLGLNKNYEFPDPLYKSIADTAISNKSLFFDDLICMTIYILQNNKDILSKESNHFKYILVDEFQDTSLLTYNLVKMLSSSNHNLFVVGDIDQSIYSFIQAEPDILLNRFISDFPQAKTLMMNTNYRSTTEIIDASNALIERNQDRYTDKKTISCDGRTGSPVLRAVTEKDQVPNTVLRLIDHLHEDLEEDYESIFLIAGNNYEHENVKKMLKQKNIPFSDSRTVCKEESGAPAVQELLSCIAFAKNSNAFDLDIINTYQDLGFSDEDIKNAINGDIEIKFLLDTNSKKITDFIKKNEETKAILVNENLTSQEKFCAIANIHKILDKYILGDDAPGMVAEAQPFATFLNCAKSLEEKSSLSLWDIIDRIKLDNNLIENENCKGVRLLTAHGAKGLESDNVIVFGDRLEQFKSEEERRLAYVAITRAKNRLFIVSNYKNHNLIDELFDYSQNIDDYFKLEFTNNKDLFKKYFLNLNEEKEEGLKVLMSGENVFLTGEAGTGKTFLLNRYIRYLRDIGKTALICAPTGIAANNYFGGLTLHKAFGIPTVPSITCYDESVAGTIDYDVVVIDEISMCRIDIFEYIAKTIKKSIAKTGKNIQVILCGDFFQLPPVVRDDEHEVLKILFKTYKEGFAFESKEWNQLNLKTIWLKEIFRQESSADEFVTCLNSIRKGEKIEYSVNYINTHCSPSPIHNAIEIHSTNFDVNLYNQNGLIKCAGEEHVYEAEIYKTIGNDVRIETTLILKAGARVMLLVNNDLGVKYRNGSLGTVSTCGEDYVDVVLDSGGCARILTRSFDSLSAPKVVIKNKKKQVEQEIIGTVVQLPLKLAYAITIHKSQGQTYDKVNLNPEGWANGQLYVALSRIKSINGLFLYKPIKEDVIKTSENVIEFYKKLNNVKALGKTESELKTL